MFRIEDERHSEFHGDFETMAAAVEELRRRAEIPWDQEPNRAPCTNWRTCGRSYGIIEFESNPYRAYVRGEQRTSLEWSTISGETGLGRGETLDGFVVYLKPGWRRSSYASATWERAGGGGSGSGASMSHDCEGIP